MAVTSTVASRAPAGTTSENVDPAALVAEIVPPSGPTLWVVPAASTWTTSGPVNTGTESVVTVPVLVASVLVADAAVVASVGALVPPPDLVG